MISRVSFHRFKQFADESFDLQPGVSLLAGGNNSGKTTILHGMAIWEFCRTALEMERGAETFVAGKMGQGLGLGDDEFSPINVPSLKHLWTNLKSARDTEVDGYTLLLGCEWGHHVSRRLEFGLALANDRLFLKATNSDLTEEDRIPRMAYLPPFAGMTDREIRTTGAIRRRRIGEGLAGAVLRNSLLDMYSINIAERKRLRGDKVKVGDADLANLRKTDGWELLQQNLRITFGAELDVRPFQEEYHSYIQVEVVKGKVDGYKIRRYPGFNKRDLMVEGSGFLQWLSVFALAYDPSIEVLLLDEPDAHLHPALQEQLLVELEKVAADSGKQILIATHSAEILRNARPSSILHVRGASGGKYLSLDSQKIGLLAGIGSDYAPRLDKLRKTKRLLFVEGTSDLAILKLFAARRGVEWPDAWVEWRTTRSQKERKMLCLELRKEIPGLVVISLRDRDDESLNGVSADLVDPTASGDASFLPRRWRRRYIESYLIWPEAMAEVLGCSEEEVIAALADSHAVVISPSFLLSDAPDAIMDLRGKEILSSPSTKPGPLAQAVGAREVAAAMKVVPDDVATFIDELLLHA